jgi:hypothetical protein
VWFFRVIETADRAWECRRGEITFDQHPGLDPAVAHIWELAEQNVPARVYVHRYDSSVETVGEIVLECPRRDALMDTTVRTQECGSGTYCRSCANTTPRLADLV